MNHREIAESLVKNVGNCPLEADCNNCQFKTYDDSCNKFEVLIKAKQWIKDNPKEQIMTNDEKIKELENQIKYLNGNHDQHITGILKEIQELKKPKYELWEPINSKYYRVPDFIGCNYDKFENSEAARYYAKPHQILDALANFVAHNDPEEINRAWDGENFHWFILDVHSPIDYNTTLKNPTTIFFSTKELAEAALQMLKSEGLIDGL